MKAGWFLGAARAACAAAVAGGAVSACATGATEEAADPPAGDVAETSEDAGGAPDATAGSPGGGAGSGTPGGGTGGNPRPDAGAADAARSDGGRSDAAPQPPPAPVLAAVAPAEIGIGSGPTVLTLTGTSFVATSYATWNGSPLATTFVGAGELTATVPAANLAAAGTFAVRVRTPTPGGGDSAPRDVIVKQGLPVLTAIAPTQASAGAAAVALVATGSGFGANALVALDGTTQTTTRFSATELRATIPAALLLTGRVIQVSVVHGGAGTSTSLPFQVVNASPTLASIAPASVPPGAADTAVTVTGTGFSGSTVVTCDGLDLATTFVGATQVAGTVPAATLAAVGTHAIGVRNPAPGGGTAPTTATLTVASPVPTVARITPAGVLAGAPLTTITVTGTGFVATSVVRVDATDVTTRRTSTTELQADVPAALLAAPGGRAITVHTPAPGGGTSGAATLTVYGVATCTDTAGVDTPLGPPGTTTTKTLDLANAPSRKRISTSGTCPIALATSSEPTRAYVVQNTLNGNVVLSAWAVCGASEDAFLTFYRRGTAPATDAEIQACTGVASEGQSGGGKASPESGGSSWCPGLTKQNGGGMTLAPCEKAVVWLQPYSFTSTTYPPPTTLKIGVDLP